MSDSKGRMDRPGAGARSVNLTIRGTIPGYYLHSKSVDSNT